MLRQKYKFLRYFFYICARKVIGFIRGTRPLGRGLAGISLPLLPPPPFLLLPAALYSRGPPRLYDWLLRQKRLGPYIRNFREQKAIPLHAKITSVSLTWITILYCVTFLIEAFWFRVLLLLLAAGISWHILSYKTLK